MTRLSSKTLVTLALCAAGCGTTRSSSLPLANEHSPQATDPLLVCATQMNLQAKQDGNSVVVRLDDDTRITYKPSDTGSLAMETHVDGKEEDPATVRKLEAAKKTGDALFRCAQNVPSPASSSPGTPTPTLGNTTSPKS